MEESNEGGAYPSWLEEEEEEEEEEEGGGGGGEYVTVISVHSTF
jgi:hypothetical protein